MKLGRFGFRMEASFGARQSRADQADRGATPQKGHDGLIKSSDFDGTVNPLFYQVTPLITP